jgi:hypothetical protein
VLGEEASLDEAPRHELAVVKRFATSLRIEEIVTLSLPQVVWENREVRLMQKGPGSTQDGGVHVCRPAGRAQDRRGHPHRHDWLELGGVGFHGPRCTAAKHMDRP